MKRVFTKGIRLCQNIIEEYIPCVCFVVMFFAFLYGIFARRILGNPVNWAYPISCMMFTFFGLLAISYADRAPGTHVVFDILYERIPQKIKPIIDLLGDLLILVPFVIVLLPTIKSFSKISIVDTILKISYKYVYVSYLVFIIETIIRYSFRLVMKIMALGKKQEGVIA